MKYSLVYAAVVAFAFSACQPSEDRPAVSPQEALRAIENEYHRGYLLTYLTEFYKESAAFAELALAAAALPQEKYLTQKQELTRLFAERQNHVISLLASLLPKADTPVQIADLPVELPASRRRDIEQAFKEQDPATRASALHAALEEWECQQQDAIRYLRKRLVPDFLRDDEGSEISRMRMLEWMQLPREQRKARVYAADLLDGICRAHGNLMKESAISWPEIEDEANNVDSLLDARRLRFHMQLCMEMDTVLRMLQDECRPEWNYAYVLPEVCHLPVRKCLNAVEDAADSFVDPLYEALLSKYSLECAEATATQSARDRVELMLGESRQLMKHAYKAQLQFIRESLTMSCSKMDDEAVLALYKEKSATIREIFRRDIEAVYSNVVWTEQGSEERPPIELPREEESPSLSRSAFIFEPPSCDTGDVYPSTAHMNCKSFQHKLAHHETMASIRKAYAYWCDSGVDLVTGQSYYDSQEEMDLQMLYLKYCFNDAEFAWKLYVKQMQDVLWPPDSGYVGTITPLLVDGAVLSLYQNHYLFYSSLLNVKLRPEVLDE